jgi:hypothetical protein
MVGDADRAEEPPSLRTRISAGDWLLGVLLRLPAEELDIVPSLDAARAAFSAGAQLVVYNLTHVLMAQLTELNRAR